MEKSKREKLEAAGWAVSSSQAFLNLSAEDAAFIEIKVALATALKARRVERQLSQVEAAKQLHSSQSRVAKMEAADPSVSIDLLLKSFLRLGGTRDEMVATLCHSA